MCVANIDANDGGAAIVEGNARVLAARLADARLFWEQDIKNPARGAGEEALRHGLHEKLGTVANKVERVAKLSAGWSRRSGVVKGATQKQVERAARLAKADLVTGWSANCPRWRG